MTHCPIAPKIRQMEARIAVLEDVKPALCADVHLQRDALEKAAEAIHEYGKCTAELEADRDAWKKRSADWAATATAQAIEADRLKDNVEMAEDTIARQKDAARSHAQWMDKTRPVVDAAVAWVAKNSIMRDPYDVDMFVCVRAYQRRYPHAEQACATNDGPSPAEHAFADVVADLPNPANS